jgi:hypothetical protein
MKSIDYCRERLGINTEYLMSSELNVEGTKTELLFNLCKEVGATRYLSGQGGINYLDKSIFKGISVETFEPKINNYYTTLSYIKKANNEG